MIAASVLAIAAAMQLAPASYGCGPQAVATIARHQEPANLWDDTCALAVIASNLQTDRGWTLSKDMRPGIMSYAASRGCSADVRWLAGFDAPSHGYDAIIHVKSPGSTDYDHFAVLSWSGDGQACYLDRRGEICVDADEVKYTWHVRFTCPVTPPAPWSCGDTQVYGSGGNGFQPHLPGVYRLLIGQLPSAKADGLR